MSAPRIAVIDYGLGNRRSMEKSLQRAGAEVTVSDGPETLAAADGIVLPGVGAFRRGMQELQSRGLDTVLSRLTCAGKPLLGVCLGMHLLFESGQEHGVTAGLGLLPGEVRLLDSGGLNLPHIGWNAVHWERPSALAEGIADGTPFYHVHSFVAVPGDPAIVLGTSDYGTRFASVVGRDNIMGTQFHPEKSSRDGIALLANFVALCGSREAVAA